MCPWSTVSLPHKQPPNCLMESALVPNGFAFVLNTSLPQRSLQRFPYIYLSMIFSDLKHMCPKAEAVAAKYSILLQGSSYLWNGTCEIARCHGPAPWSSWCEQRTGWGNLGLNGVLDLCKTETDYTVWQGLPPENVFTGHMVSQIPLQPQFSVTLSLTLAVHTGKLVHH